MADLNFAERIGLEVLRRRIDRAELHIHAWSPSELAAIARIDHGAEVIAALAGATSGALLAIIEIWLGEGVLDLMGGTPWREQLPRWSMTVALILLVSGAEVLFLYAYVLRAVARIASIAGLSLSAREVEQLVVRGLTRAALELPNPRQPIYGLDPYARVPRWKLIAYAVLYRIKVGATSFLLRVLLRRILSRTALRVFIPLTAVPVFALWNALVARWVFREVRIRVAGPLVVQQGSERLAAMSARLDDSSRRLILGAAGEAIVRGEDAHPNYALLLERLFEVLAIAPETVQPAWPSIRKALKSRDPAAQRAVLFVLVVTVILNSRVRRAQRDLLTEAFQICGRSLRYEALLDLRDEFLRGQGLNDPQLSRLGLD